MSGSSLVGLGVQKNGFGGSGLGLAPDTNVPYGVDEFAEYDPIVPFTLLHRHGAPCTTLRAGFKSVYYSFRAYPAQRSPAATASPTCSCHTELPGPSGSVFVARVGNEDLYRIPDPARPPWCRPSSVAWPSTDAPGKAVPVEWTGPVSAPGRHGRVLASGSPAARVLGARMAGHDRRPAVGADALPLDDVPGADSSGRHVIELHYWPDRFTEGLVVAACTGLALIVAAFVARRRKPAPPASGEGPKRDETDASRSCCGGLEPIGHVGLADHRPAPGRQFRPRPRPRHRRSLRTAD